MSDQDLLPGRAAQFTSFATLGLVGVAHELAGVAMAGIDGADPEL